MAGLIVPSDLKRTLNKQEGPADDHLSLVDLNLASANQKLSDLPNLSYTEREGLAGKFNKEFRALTESLAQAWAESGGGADRKASSLWQATY